MPEATPAVVSAFVARLPRAIRRAYVEHRELATRLAALYMEGRRRWPGLNVPEAAYAEFVAQRIGESEGPEQTLPVLHGDDLYLACACASGDSVAIEVFESTFHEEIGRSVLKMAGDPVRGDDFKQELRQKLFMGRAGLPPKVSEYSGRGSLRRWLRVCARRTYIDLMRASQREREVLVTDERLFESEPTSDIDPELFVASQSDREAFCRAFEVALAGLSRRQRTLLRQHFVHDIRLEQMSSIYRVHPATVSRWLSQARLELLSEIRRILELELGTSETDLAGLVEAGPSFDDDIVRVLQAAL